ncbi:hypothetical protein [Fundicoccus culcitae]|uniref:ATPase n=1 Tax=Fundicoccus culcitae TaxID=2969821 RepID=A0ABY5P4V6_9LACT|nr:hypothetical protein [Fundicoccus culcitae]UUX33640.1 hypothetical protein NRE15_12140 [Fundicoccus culcitae]
MSTDVIDYLREIEVQIEYKRREVAETLQTLDDGHRKAVEELERNYQAELTDYLREKEQANQARLELEEAALQQTFSEKREALLAQYEQQKDQLVERIVKEVLNQYGYRQNEEVDPTGGAV